MNDPRLYTIRMRFGRPVCADIGQTVRREIAKIAPRLGRGAPIAVAVGSRGIANIDKIVRAAAECLREGGAKPFIVPAMGSHGGATAEGQARLLAAYGITEERIGIPVVSSMEVAELGTTEAGNRVFVDRAAHDADGIVLVNRIKPHTDFHGLYESGLVKMGVIGLGKHAAAVELHSLGATGLRDLISLTFKTISARERILFGLAVVENAYDETALIEAVAGPDILSREPALLELARKNMPALPVEDIDVLIVDRIGKEISGTGMDPNIIGRVRIAGQPEPPSPRIKRIVACGLTLQSHGNALGIGLADVITGKLYKSIDFEAMYVNVRASLFLERAKVPFVAKNDADAFALALKSCGFVERGAERIVRIKDTLHCGDAQVSNAVLNELADTVEVLNGPSAIFDESGNLIEF